MAIDPQRHTLVFVGGLHRSGTTILANLIAAHPDASGFSGTGVPADEGQHLQSVYPTARAYGGPGRFGFAPEAGLDESSALVSAENAARLLSDWAPHWDVERRVLVEKSPPNLIRMRFLQALFPQARFVVIVRNPAVVALATQKWSKTSIGSLVRHWVVCHDRFEADRPRLSRVIRIPYETLVGSPEACMAGVYEFLGLDAGFMPAHDLRSDANAPYLDRWRGARLRALLLARRFGEGVERHGYSLRELERSPSD